MYLLKSVCLEELKKRVSLYHLRIDPNFQCINFNQINSFSILKATWEFAFRFEYILLNNYMRDTKIHLYKQTFILIWRIITVLMRSKKNKQRKYQI